MPRLSQATRNHLIHELNPFLSGVTIDITVAATRVLETIGGVELRRSNPELYEFAHAGCCQSVRSLTRWRKSNGASRRRRSEPELPFPDYPEVQRRYPVAGRKSQYKPTETLKEDDWNAAIDDLEAKGESSLKHARQLQAYGETVRSFTRRKTAAEAEPAADDEIGFGLPR